LATQLDKTLEISLQALKTLNVFLVENLPEIIDIEQLRDLPKMTAHDKSAAMSILANMTSSAVIIQYSLLESLIYTMVKLSIKYGNCTKSPLGYVLYGHILTLSRTDIGLGYRLGILAIDIMEKFKPCEVETMVLLQYNVMIRHFSEHARSPLNEFPHIVQISK